MTQQILSGFNSPVHDSQQWYRIVLDAMSRPGNVCFPISTEVFSQAPSPCSKTAASIALTLFDNDTSIWLQTSNEKLTHWLQFHCGCPITTDKNAATFALITDGNSLPDLTQFSIGSSEFPDRSTTLVIQVESVTHGEPVEFSGSGIATTNKLNISGLDSSFWETQKNNRSLFPQGFDTILAAPDGVVCIPRTTTIRRQTPCM